MDKSQAVCELDCAGECAASPLMTEGPRSLKNNLGDLRASVVSPSAGFDGPRRLEPRFAVLIDGDNVGARYADDLFFRVSKLGELAHCLIYGDWRGQKGKRWKAVANSRIGVSLIQPLPEAGAKNATDMSMVIHAMDLLHRYELEGFCLVSADGDFVPLVNRLQQAGRWVYGYAASHPSRALARTCDQFFRLGLPQSEKSAVALKVKHMDLVLLDEAFARHEDDERWAKLPAIGQYLRQASVEYAENRWGFPSLTKLLRASGRCCVDEISRRASFWRLTEATTANQAGVG